MLSIIIPVYNAEKTIERCLDSIFVTDIKTPGVLVEVIAINDGSKDDSLAVLESLESKYPKLRVIDQQNKGAGGARNTGIRAARTKFISFVDSDDRVSDKYLEVLFVNSAADAVYFDVEKRSRYGAVSILKPVGFLGPMVAGFFKRDLFVINDLYFPEGINYEDNAIGFLVRASAKNTCYVADSLYIYEFIEGSQSNSRSLKHLSSRLESMRYLQEHAIRLGLFDKNRIFLGELAFNLAYIPALSLCFRRFGSYQLFVETRLYLEQLYISIPSNLSFKKRAFCFCIERLGHVGYLALCLKRLNKIFKD